MKTLLPTLVAAAALASAPALAQNAGMAGMAMSAPAAKSGTGVGEVKALDAKAGKVTLHHGPVAALGWPAMTMTFKVAPELLKTVKPGQKVRFTVIDGDQPVVTAIAPQ
jgi:Cu(I)/Ag(I) efflux system protein CusF